MISHEVTITLPLGGWFAVVLMFFIGGKLLQQGGVKYGWGHDWHGLTLAGSVLMLVATMALLFAGITDTGGNADG